MVKSDVGHFRAYREEERPDETAVEPFEAFAIRLCRDFLDGLKNPASPGPASDSAVPSDSAERRSHGDSRKARHD